MHNDARWPSADDGQRERGVVMDGSMNAIKTALVLVTLGMLHPGFALFVVGLATLGVALQLALELTTGDEAVPTASSEAKDS